MFLLNAELTLLGIGPMKAIRNSLINGQEKCFSSAVRAAKYRTDLCSSDRGFGWVWLFSFQSRVQGLLCSFKCFSGILQVVSSISGAACTTEALLTALLFEPLMRKGQEDGSVA